MTRSLPAAGSPAHLFGRVEHLLARCAQRDAKSLVHLYDLTAPRVLGLVSRVVGPGEGAAEVTRDTYATVWSEPVPERAGLPWLLHVAHARAVARSRTRVPRQRGAGAVHAFPPDRGWMPGLAEDEREALSEVYLRGHGVEVADQRLGWPSGTAVATVHRAMLHLAALHNGAQQDAAQQDASGVLA
jgi:RNA polymerase sigma-70 factor, ECF subfamily